jgi:hypothetical protein
MTVVLIANNLDSLGCLLFVKHRLHGYPGFSLPTWNNRYLQNLPATGFPGRKRCEKHKLQANMKYPAKLRHGI